MSTGPVTGLVLGVGSPDRGDDGVGPVVALRVAAARLPGVEVEVCEDPTSLVHRWAGHDTAVVVDAVSSGGDPGSLLVLETGQQHAPFADRAWVRTGRGGTHALGLAAAVELARALGTLPRRLVLVGVEGESSEYGVGLTPAVEAAVAPAFGAVLEVLAEVGARREVDHVPG